MLLLLFYVIQKPSFSPDLNITIVVFHWYLLKWPYKNSYPFITISLDFHKSFICQTLFYSHADIPRAGLQWNWPYVQSDVDDSIVLLLKCLNYFSLSLWSKKWLLLLPDQEKQEKTTFNLRENEIREEDHKEIKSRFQENKFCCVEIRRKLSQDLEKITFMWRSQEN